MNLFRITIILNQPQAQVALVFKDGDKATEARTKLVGIGVGVASLADDYGNEVDVNRGDITAVIKTDIESFLNGEAALALAQARSNKHTQTQAQSEGLIPRGGAAIIPGGRA